jgi:hypothetical protein
MSEHKKLTAAAWRFKVLCLGAAAALRLVCAPAWAPAATIDLSGKWELQLDPLAQGDLSNGWQGPFSDTIRLPGTLSEARKGNPLGLEPRFQAPPPERMDLKHGLTFGRDKKLAATNACLECLYPRFSYVGPAWYRRQVEIPANWASQDARLVIERAMWSTRLWINGRFAGARDSLTTPHRYDIGALLKPGRNELVVRVDNRRQAAIGNPHAYTEEAQTIWNGMVGKIELETRPKVRIDGLQLRPDLARHGVQVTLEMHNGSSGNQAGELCLEAGPENFKGARSPKLTLAVSLAPGDTMQTVFYPLGTNVEFWSEFTPRLYRVGASLAAGGARSEATASFGMRSFKANGHQFTINGQPVFLRGTVECCVFPKTGYPDMTGKQWERIFRNLNAYGLNHMRFHTWCPPEIAFDLADRYGIYLEVELPNWSFKIGQEPEATAFFRREGERMIREYGNHPSWVMFTMGNELKGDYLVLDDLESYFRRLDPQLVCDSTTYPSAGRGKAPEPADDYYISQDTTRGRVRGQDVFNNTRPNTEASYQEPAGGLEVPLVSHEVGQYCVYPNLAELPKYNRGALRALAFEAIRADLKQKDRLDEAPLYTRDSGKLAVLLYKEEIERALRTPNQAGFQLLEAEDFPGQGTSTVGWLDAFWDSKGLTTPREFQKFCGPVVPLALMPKRVFQSDEPLIAGVQVANFGPAAISNATIEWGLFDGHKRLGGGSFQAPAIPLGHGIELGRIEQSLSGIRRAAKLRLSVAIAGTSIGNDWFVWAYPAQEPAAVGDAPAIFQTPSESFYQALREGKRVLLLAARESARAPLAAQFVPVFWNPVMFPNQPGSMGAMIDATNPLFADFPTDEWTDWQWWELTAHSYALNLDGLQEKPAMPFRFIDKFNRNALPAAIFEAQAGSGRLLVCTLDITRDLDNRIAARQLRRSILRYMAGDKFHPRRHLSLNALSGLFQ